jgi:hypothetical protein
MDDGIRHKLRDKELDIIATLAQGSVEGPEGGPCPNGGAMPAIDGQVETFRRHKLALPAMG